MYKIYCYLAQEVLVNKIQTEFFYCLSKLGRYTQKTVYISNLILLIILLLPIKFYEKPNGINKILSWPLFRDFTAFNSMRFMTKINPCGLCLEFYSKLVFIDQKLVGRFFALYKAIKW